MAKKKQKYYAIADGESIGIFSSWNKCKDFVLGYSGAKYKSFTNFDDAQNYLYRETGCVVEEYEADEIFR